MTNKSEMTLDELLHTLDVEAKINLSTGLRLPTGSEFFDVSGHRCMKFRTVTLGDFIKEQAEAYAAQEVAKALAAREFVPIADAPDEWKDGRDLLVKHPATGRVSISSFVNSAVCIPDDSLVAPMPSVRGAAGRVIKVTIMDEVSNEPLSKEALEEFAALKARHKLRGDA